jgi:hypothetical protein
MITINIFERIFMKYSCIILALSLLACGQGPQGIPGPQGLVGNNGDNCSVTPIQPETAAPNGGTLISCSDGTNSLILNGATGATGSPGTSVTTVQFCLNPVSSFPSTFPEVGFCINGQLWAVYSANGGFLTALPNGNYSSDGENASCTFTVTGCTISNQSN